MFFKKPFFTDSQKLSLVEAITLAEAMTSGEIRVHTEAKCKAEDTATRATEVFFKLKMNQTAQKNGVLIYLAYEDKKFAIMGDEGINAVVPATFWDGTKEVMRGHFQQGEFYEGVIFAVQETGFHLKQYFPLLNGDKNELTNELSEE